MISVFSPHESVITPSYPQKLDVITGGYIAGGSAATDKNTTIVLQGLNSLNTVITERNEGVLAWLPPYTAKSCPQAYVTTKGLYVYESGDGDTATYNFTAWSSAPPFATDAEEWTLVLHCVAATITASLAGSISNGPYTITKGTISPNIVLPTHWHVGQPMHPLYGVKGAILHEAIAIEA